MCTYTFRYVYEYNVHFRAALYPCLSTYTLLMLSCCTIDSGEDAPRAARRLAGGRHTCPSEARCRQSRDDRCQGTGVHVTARLRHNEVYISDGARNNVQLSEVFRAMRYLSTANLRAKD